MKVLAVIGSPRMNGNTYKTVKQIEQRICGKDSSVEFEYIQLCKTDLQICKGCYVCIKNGENLCPLKDSREAIEKKMQTADAFIFASPVYTFNVSSTMKNFLDRFAYRCHRPDFHGRKAMVVTTTGAVGLGFVGFLLSFMIGAMGFITCAKAGVTFPPAHELDEKKLKKETVVLNKKTDLFYKKISDTRPVNPSLLKLFIFKKQQKAFRKSPVSSADHSFWERKGWLQKGEKYYYPVSINGIKRLLASAAAKVI